MRTHFLWFIVAFLGCSNATPRRAACPAIEITSIADSTRLITTSDIVDARPSQTDGRWVLNIDVTDDAAKRIQDFSKTHVGQTIALVDDGKTTGTPRITGPLTGKGIQIDAGDKAGAESMAAAIKDGCRR
jgi:preprotein translocase subunit SecD